MSVEILQGYLGLLAANKLQEAATEFNRRNPSGMHPVLAQYISACIQKRMGQKDAARVAIDALAAPLLARAGADGNGFEPLEEKILAAWITDSIENGVWEERKQEIGAAIADDYIIEDELAELYALVQKAYQALRNSAAPVAATINRIGWTFSITLTSLDSLARFLHWLPRHHNLPGSGEKFYSNFAKYKQDNHSREEDVARLIWNEVGGFLKPGDRVLDAGCGDALVLKMLLEKIPLRLFGVDGVAGAEKLAHANVPSLDFVIADLESVPHPDGAFDLVLTSDTLEHVLKPARVLRELYRLTRPGGHLFISVPDGRFDNYIGHINFFSTLSLASLMEDLGVQPRMGMHAQGIFGHVQKPA